MSLAPAWSIFLVETLHRCGLRAVFVCPGSRSAPLAVAFAEHPGVEARPVLDERSAGFLAVGALRAHRRPVAVLCTSGTAAVNFAPAVVEADEDGLPLIVLTADRPPQLRHQRAGQTIDQVKLYGAAPRLYAELPVPDARPEVVRHLRELLKTAYRRSQGPLPGPVHLNCPFEEPLLADASRAAGAETVWQTLLPAVVPEERGDLERTAAYALPEAIAKASRCLIVAGPSSERLTGDVSLWLELVRRLALALSAPVLADALSPARHHAALEAYACSRYAWVLQGSAQARALTPEAVVLLGDLPTSKPLRQWLAALDVPCVNLCAHHAQHQAALLDSCPPPPALEALVRAAEVAVETPAGSDRATTYVKAWKAADAHAGQRLETQLKEAPPCFEGAVARVLGQQLPAQTPVFVAASMPVRDVEAFWPQSDRGYHLHANRGANGIDGTLSSAIGLALAAGRPSVLLTGDLALLHDTNGFLSAPLLEQASLTVVCLNNGGGAIFEQLPVAALDRTSFERFFLTPQQVNFEVLAAAYDVPYRRITTPVALAACLQALPARGLHLVEVVLDREADVAFRQGLLRAMRGESTVQP